jgi:hypothetical protein
MLASITSSSSVAVTGIIDCDSAILAPEFMAYRAPFWLWTSMTVLSSDEDKEENANLPVVTPEDHILKQVFLNEASEKFKWMAFAPEVMLARRMFHVLQKGMFSNWHMEEAEKVIKEWIQLHPEDGVVFEEESDDESDAGSNPGSDAEFEGGSEHGSYDSE